MTARAATTAATEVVVADSVLACATLAALGKDRARTANRHRSEAEDMEASAAARATAALLVRARSPIGFREHTAGNSVSATTTAAASPRFGQLADDDLRLADIELCTEKVVVRFGVEERLVAGSAALRRLIALHSASGRRTTIMSGLGDHPEVHARKVRGASSVGAKSPTTAAAGTTEIFAADSEARFATFTTKVGLAERTETVATLGCRRSCQEACSTAAAAASCSCGADFGLVARVQGCHVGAIETAKVNRSLEHNIARGLNLDGVNTLSLDRGASFDNEVSNVDLPTNHGLVLRVNKWCQHICADIATLDGERTACIEQDDHTRWDDPVKCTVTATSSGEAECRTQGAVVPDCAGLGECRRYVLKAPETAAGDVVIHLDFVGHIRGWNKPGKVYDGRLEVSKVVHLELVAVTDEVFELGRHHYANLAGLW